MSDRWARRRALDQRVAEIVFGLQTKWVKRKRYGQPDDLASPRLWVSDGVTRWLCPDYSWDLHAAGFVLQKMIELGFSVTIENGVADGHLVWLVRFSERNGDYLVTVTDTELPAAICEAAVAAMKYRKVALA